MSCLLISNDLGHLENKLNKLVLNEIKTTFKKMYYDKRSF